MIDLVIPPWLRWLLMLAAVLVACMWIKSAVASYDENRRAEGRLEVQAAWNAENAKAEAAELERARTNAAETLRRIERQGDSHETAARVAAAAAADRARADDAERVSRDHVAVLEAIAVGAATCDTASVADRQAAGTAARMLADMQRRADAHAGILATYADAARIAGETCVRDYEALKP